MRVTVHKKLIFLLIGIVSMGALICEGHSCSIIITFVLFSDYSILACTSFREQKRKIVNNCMAIMKTKLIVQQHTHSRCQIS